MVTMRTKQKIMLWIGIVIIVLMCLFPPWVRIIEVEGSRIVSGTFYLKPKRTRHYVGADDKQYLLSPPKPLMIIHELNSSAFSSFNNRGFPFEDEDIWNDYFDESEQHFSLDYVRIDLQRLGIQCAIVALITVGLLCTFTTKEKYKHKAQKVEIRK